MVACNKTKQGTRQKENSDDTGIGQDKRKTLMVACNRARQEEDVKVGQ